MNVATAKDRWINIATAGFCLSALAVAALLTRSGDALSLTAGGAPLGGLCMWRELLGLGCPFCGMTRSFVALAHLDLAGALSHHPAGPLMFVAYAATGVLALALSIAGRRALLFHPAFLRWFQVTVVLCLVVGTARLVAEVV